MHRFFLPRTNLTIGHPVDLTPLGKQLTRVLRLAPGAEVTLFNGDGYEYRTELSTLTRESAAGVVLSRAPGIPEPALALTLYQCSLKADKFEWVLQKGTELGVTRFTPVISARSIVRPAQALTKKYDRWRTILREAAEQSGRSRLPELAAPQPLEQALAGAPAMRLLAYEAARPEVVPSLAAMSPRVADSPAISLLIGPEGGFDPGEIDRAQTTGWQIVSLGPRILRAETAALAAAAILTAHAG